MTSRDRPRKSTILAAAFAVLAVALAACGTSAGSSGSEQKTWIHGILAPKGDSGYQLMAKDRGFYTKQGVHVEIKSFVGNIQLNQALISGAIDSGDTAPDPVFDASLKRSNVKIIGSTLPKITYALIAKNSIKSFADLQGKTIGASAPGAFPEAVTRAMLAQQGLDPSKVKVVATGDDAQRFQALLAGRIDAAAVSDQFVPVAQKNGAKIHLLGEAQNIIPQYPRFYLAANGKSLKEKPDAAVRFLAGEIQGLCYAVTHPKAEQQVAAKYSKTSPTDPKVVYVQQAIAKAHAASATSAIPMKNLEFLQSFRIKNGFQKGKVDFSKLVDPSFREKALKRVKLPQTCLDDPNAKG